MKTVRHVLFASGLLAISSASLYASEGVFNVPTLVPELATKAVEVAVEACRDQDAQVTAVVVDRHGTPQALKRDRFAGPHSVETAIRKAWTAVSFRTDTLELRQITDPSELGYGIQYLPNVSILGGGKLIQADGRIIGAVGVSGSPSGQVDDACAAAAVDAIKDDLL